jgi:hypothetical protein
MCRGCPRWRAIPMFVSACLGQRALHASGIEVLPIDRRARLLSPGFIQPTGINAINRPGGSKKFIWSGNWCNGDFLVTGDIIWAWCLHKPNLRLWLK